MRCAWLLLFALDFCLCLQNILYPHGQIVTRRNINNLPIGHYNLLQNCRYSIHRQNSLTTLHHGNHKSDDKDYDKLINNVTTSNYYLQNDSSPKMFSRQSIQSLNLKSLPSFPRIMVLAIGVSFLIPVLLRRRITKTDFVTFVLTTASLSVFDKFRSVFKPWVRKFKSFKDNVLKHTTPITKSYFFKNENAADRVTILGVWINILLSIIKFAGGILFNSAVLVADAGHSLSDLLSDFITLWAVQISRIPADEDHPYG